jgi:hypothetical protein
MRSMDSRVPLEEPVDFEYPEFVVVQSVRGILNYGHLFNHMCMGFLRMYFHNEWIVCVRVWLLLHKGTIDWNDCGKMEWVRYSVEDWESLAQSIVDMCDETMDEYSPIDRIFRSAQGLGFAHYFGHEAQLRSMFPNFLVKDWLEQTQMIMSMWFIHNRDRLSVDLHLWMYMLHVGGCFPDPILPAGVVPMDQGSFRDRVLIAPPAHCCRLFKSTESPLPWHLCGFPICGSLAQYQE